MKRRTDPSKAAGTRADIAAWANLQGVLASRRGAAQISTASTRQELIAWLKWMDPNGLYTDEANAEEENDPLTLNEAWDEIERMFDDDVRDDDWTGQPGYVQK